MSENEGDVQLTNGSAENGTSNGVNGSHSSSRHKHKKSDKDREHRKETEEERKIRKDRERKEREDRYKKEGRRPETEEERRIRKEKERKERDERHKKEGRREETEEERRIRKEKERKDRDKRDGRHETEEERRVRKEKERKEREERHKREGKRLETEEERRIRKEKERKHGKREETEEERRIRKDKERRERKEKEAAKVKEEEEDFEVKEEVKEDGDVKVEEEESMEYESEVKEEVKTEEEEEEDEVPLAKSKSRGSKRKSYAEEDEDYEDEDYEEEKPSKKKAKKAAKPEPPAKKNNKKAAAVKHEPVASPTKRGGKKGAENGKEEPTVWKWWEEEKKDDGTKWRFLEHRGPLFAPAYERIPKSVRFYYDGKAMRLSQDAEEIATFYGRMLDHDYTTKEVFNKNFFKDWRKNMTEEERQTIRDLSKCDFTEINEYFKKVSEERKARGKEERKAEKEKNEAIQLEYGFCAIDGHKEKIGNFRIEPPGLFRGRGEHPKQGMLKKRVNPEDVTINCSKDSEIPEPPEGHNWKEVRHDNNVTWLASWTENVQNQIKYVMLNPSSKLKGEKDMMKYEKAKQLKLHIGKIRSDYVNDFKAKEMRLRQRAVALYFIDKLALRAGNEKDEDQADTVGCCSLRVEHLTLHLEKDGKEFVVEFDFLGKDSIRYHNLVSVEKRVFKNLQYFMDNKKPEDDLFDRLNTSILNEYLNGLMPGLTAKVFRTYNASITLQQQLAELTDENDSVVAKVLSYNRANRAVAVLCNHQRAVPKTHDKSMANLQTKIDAKKETIEQAEKEFKAAKKAYKSGSGGKDAMEKKKKAVERLMEQFNKLETQAVDKEENKTIALGTSKLNYLDPRISVAWCKKFDVPIEKVYNKTQREKFRWAIEMAGPDYEF